MSEYSPPHRLRRLITIAALAALAAFGAWRIVSLNLAEHYAARGDVESAGRALEWVPGHPRASEIVARSLLASEPAKAAELLRTALPANPMRGMTYALLGAAHNAQGRHEAAGAALEAAVRLAPELVSVRLIAAADALARNDLPALLQHWSVALSRRTALHNEIFPALAALVANPETHPAFRQLLDKRVPWWPAFVRFAADRQESPAPMLAAYELSLDSPANRLEGKQLNPVITRLQRDKLWLDARLAWMDTLAPERLEGMGNIFNGDFEQPISDVGYDWQRSRASHIVIDTAPTAGAGGDRALFVLFRGPRVRFQHLQQYLSLPPGRYTLRGRARLDDLQTTRGLTWNLSCIGQTERPIARSEPFVGRSPWRSFEMPVSVPPDDCPAQRLRLQLDGRVALDFDARGQAWFDDLRIDPLD